MIPCIMAFKVVQKAPGNLATSLQGNNEHNGLHQCQIGSEENAGQKWETLF